MRNSLLLAVLGVVFGVFISLVAFPLGMLVAIFGETTPEDIANRFVVFWIGSALGLIGGFLGRRLGGVVMIIAGLISVFALGGFAIVSFLLLTAGGIVAFREKKGDYVTTRANDTPRNRIVIRVLSASQDMVCRKCGGTVPLGSKVCVNCGSRLYEERAGIKCPVCKAPLIYATKTSRNKLICGYCFSELTLENVYIPPVDKKPAISPPKRNVINRERLIWTVGILFAVFIGAVIGSAGNSPSPPSTITMTKTILITTSQEMSPVDTTTGSVSGGLEQGGRSNVTRGTVTCPIPFTGVLQITIVEYIRGDRADHEMRRASVFNPEPKRGYEYLLLKVNVKYVQGVGTIDIGPHLFEVFVDGVGYDTEYFAIMPEEKSMLSAHSLMAGASIEGWLPFIIPKGKEFVLQFWSLDPCYVKP